MKLTSTTQRNIARALRYYLNNNIPSSDEEKTLRRVADEYDRRAKAQERHAKNTKACAAIDIENTAGRTWRIGRSTIKLSQRRHSAMCAAMAAIKSPGELIDPAPYLPRSPGISLTALKQALFYLRGRLAAQLPIIKRVSLTKNGDIVCKPLSK